MKSLLGNIMHLPLLNTITGRSLCCASRALPTRRISGAGSSQVLVGCPTKPEFRIAPDLFRTLILERLSVDCWSTVTDGTEQHAPTQAVLRTRASAPERTLARVCREAGASVRFNAKLVDMNIAVEVLASGLPLFHGAQFAVDITLRSALTATGLPRPGAAVVDGIVCMAARADKERKYSELLSSPAADAGWWWSLSRLAVVGVWKLLTLSNGWRWPAPATHHPICNGQLFCHAHAGVDGKVPHLAELLSEE